MRRLLCALLALLLLLGGAAGAEEGRLWLHGDFETVETDGYRLQNGFYEYEKIAHKGDISLYAVGYEAESGYALLTPEEAGGDLTYERMEDADLGGAGKALALHGRGQPLGLSRRGGGGLLLQHHDRRAGNGRGAAGRRSGGADRLSVPARGTHGRCADAGRGHIRLHAGDGHARRRWRRAGPGNGLGRGGRRRIRDLPARRGGRIPLRFGGALARNLRRGGRGAAGGCVYFRQERRALALYLGLADGSECPAEAVLLPGEEFSYAAVFGLTGGETPENAAMLERLLDSLALS